MAPQVSTGLLRDVGGCGDFGGGENLDELHETGWDIGNRVGGVHGARGRIVGLGMLHRLKENIGARRTEGGLNGWQGA